MTRSTAAVHVRILGCDAVEEPIKGLDAAAADRARPYCRLSAGSAPPPGCAATLQPLILRSHQARIISSFQPADNEVTPCHLLEMVYEQDVDHHASGSTDYGDRLRGDLLGDVHAEARSQLCDEPDDCWCALLHQSSLGDVPRSL